MMWQKSFSRLKELNIGNNIEYEKSLTSAVTTSWGVEWDEDMIARDIMQNFFDANKDRLSEVNVNVDGSLVTITAPTSFDLMRLFYLGSEKSDDDIGQYGEGFKAAIMCLMRDHEVFPAAISLDKLVSMRISSAAVADTGLRPIVYDFFKSDRCCSGSKLILQGCSKKLQQAFKTGFDHFLYDGNSLLGEILWKTTDGNFAIYHSTNKDTGHIFYRKLKRGEISDIPLVIVINKKYSAIERKINKDRDRNAFGDDLTKIFYKLFARYATRNCQAAQRVIIETARNCWQRGHALLSAIADYRSYYRNSWSSKDAEEVFGDKYFAKTGNRNGFNALQYEKIEKSWIKEGRLALPGYFTSFGVINAEQHLEEIQEKAMEEAKNKDSRPPSPAENNSLDVLRYILAELDPEMAKVLTKSKISCCVAETEVLLGQLKDNREWRSYEVFLAANVFLADFPEAISIYLHEHAHIFGYDGSRGFTDALTKLLAAVIANRVSMDKYEKLWNAARDRVYQERSESPDRDKTIDSLLDSKNTAQLRDLLGRVPENIIKDLLKQDENKIAAYL